MKQVLDRHLPFRVFSISLLVFLLFSISLNAQEQPAADQAAPAEETAAAGDAAAPAPDAAGDTDGDPAKGKSLFNQNCAACHALNRKMTGPALANVEARLAEEEGLDREWLYKWIKNSPGMIKSGDAYAVKVYNENAQQAMTAFPTLSNEDIDNILAYTVAAPPDKKPTTTDVAAGGGLRQLR